MPDCVCVHMRFVLAFVVIIVLAACSSDVPSDPDESSNLSVNDTEPTNETNAVLPAPIDDSDLLPIPDPANESANLSEEWVLGEDESGDPIVVEPRARLNESFLGIVPSADPTPRIVSFSLLSASTNRVIPEYANMTGSVQIDRARVPQRLAVRANYAGEVGSVLFSLNGAKNHRVENAPPFALHGVDEFGVYTPWTPDRGRFSITATPFAGRDAIGVSHEPTSVLIEFFAPGYLDRVSNP